MVIHSQITCRNFLRDPFHRQRHVYGSLQPRVRLWSRGYIRGRQEGRFQTVYRIVVKQWFTDIIEHNLPRDDYGWIYDPEDDGDYYVDFVSYRAVDVHHLISPTYGGSDEPDNLISVCHDCHKILNDELFESHKKINKQIRVENRKKLRSR